MSLSERPEDEKWMRLALTEAAAAAKGGEVPVGAVLVRDGVEMIRTHNLCETLSDPTAHAELLAISRAAREQENTRLSDCTLYVTMEPCPMCMGGAVRARIGRICFAAKDPRAGACGSLIDLASYPLESSPECGGGLLAEESLSLLRSFFEERRNADRSGKRSEESIFNDVCRKEDPVRKKGFGKK